ncbi:MAG: UDP-2,4-diacetamido-2,4,6-trideoxy-beta-L-altropyranose hydrolase [Betaproteobacteria bacterium ADurb.Bin341]|nr:MAG: UDP-2,4-diacetamido-2,4,6-trideoxy-beta-L-altropyranose hydrolase [Betaproteobacteria bacterium ADurb.Bin341]
MQTRVVIRADASVNIGSGHVIRCLTLAEVLRQQGATVEFVCREHVGNLLELIHQRDFVAHTLECDEWSEDARQTLAVLGNPVDWLIVDHYGLDKRWESQLRSACRHLMAIDDLADRPHDCDLLLDQNYYLNPECRYQGLLPDQCTQLLGPGYALLSTEYEQALQEHQPRAARIEKVLVFFGGSDPTGETEKLLTAIESFSLPELSFDVVVGASNPKCHVIEARCQQLQNVHFHCQTSEMAMLCAEADLALGAGGSANWERFSLALPCMVVTTAENQRETVAALVQDGYVQWLGWHAEITPQHMAKALCRAVEQVEEMIAMGERARRLIAGKGRFGAQYVAECILSAA